MIRIKIQYNKSLNDLCKKLVLLSMASASVLMAGGYKIPDTSLDGIALCAANVAHASGADAAYYNPANMNFMNDENTLEVDIMSISLSDINYQGSYTSSTTGHDLDSKKEHFFLPSLHYVSGSMSGTRFGLSILSPAGLSKRWDAQPAQSSAEEFTLKVVEINPSISFLVSNKVSVGLGFRALYSEGAVKASYPTVYSQDMSGDSIDYGYNAALSYKPTHELDVAFTYRSQVNLTEEGSATLFYDANGPAEGGVALNSKYDTNVIIPIPATISLATAYTFPTKTTFELVYERNIWSAYSELDFNYASPTAEAVFGKSKQKNWNDTNTFRLGITQKLDEITLMAGAVIDKTPVPVETIGFELPDSNSLSVSLGGRYQIAKSVNIGLAALYSMREDREVTNASLDGKFTNSKVLALSTGLEYKF
ncbi:MAG: outer membrane protein transport protein [Sulfurimonas sp.]|nr:outer membrane protein transport protein [Sulfurimonas sp.]